MRAVAVVVAAGRGARFGGEKLFQPLGGRPLLQWTLQAFEACPAVDSITLVVSEETREATAALVAAAGLSRVGAICLGGAERQESVYLGLRAAPPAALVAVHDGARPLISPDLIAHCIEAAAEHGAAAPALPVVDTLKRKDTGGQMRETVDRGALLSIQTPQVFRRDLLLEAHETARRDRFTGTDDAALVERLGHPVHPVPGSRRNLKVTTPEDLALAEALLGTLPDARGRGGEGADGSSKSKSKSRSDRTLTPTLTLTRSLPGHPLAPSPSRPVALRVGTGCDVHRLVPGRPLVLGGITIPHSHGLEGHSDADVLCHAIGDAVLGAAGLGDLGRHFPDTDPRWQGASSLDLLRRIAEQARAAGWEPAQVDATLLAEAPKIAPHVPLMVERIATALGIPPEAVNLKATTNEGMGFVGRREGMAAQAVAVVTPCCKF